MFKVKGQHYGMFNRYIVHVRLTDDMDSSPSGDDFKSYVVWAEDPYQAHSCAIFTATHIEGRKVRFFIGVTEMPHQTDQDAPEEP